jgi:hypothetical protein
MKTLILKNIWGGLGDHLFYSHLPRTAKVSGAFDRVMVSNQSAYRNPDYKRLIWEPNPYLDGFTDEDGLCPSFSSVPEGMNILDRIMTLLGIDDGVRFHEPELYYQPPPRPDMTEKTVYDPNYVSHVGEIEPRRIAAYLSRRGVKVDYQFKVREKSYPLPGLPELNTPTIFDYCQVIASCRQFVCLTSGGATLAAALKRPVIAFYGFEQAPMFHHSPMHRYVYAGPAGKLMRQRAERIMRGGARRILNLTGIRRRR